MNWYVLDKRTTIKQASVLGIAQFQCVSKLLLFCLREKEVQTDKSIKYSRLTLTLGLCKAVKVMEIKRQDLCKVFGNV